MKTRRTKLILKNFKLPEPLAKALMHASKIQRRTQTSIVCAALEECCKPKKAL